MKKLKKALALVFILSISAALAACGSSSSKEIDAQALADELMEKVEFVDELSPVKSEMVPKLYGIDNAEEAYVYMGSGPLPRKWRFSNSPMSKLQKTAFPKSRIISPPGRTALQTTFPERWPGLITPL